MSESNDFSAVRVLDYLNDCGCIHAPREFFVGIIQNIDGIVPYDKARAYFFNGNGNVSDTYLVGVDKKWTDAYLTYYSTLENGRYGIQSTNRFKGISQPVSVKNWSMMMHEDEFISDYIRPQGLSSTMAFSLYDDKAGLRACFMFDRVEMAPFSYDEKKMMNMAVPHLNNLYKNFFYAEKTERQNNIRKDVILDNLTPREGEIAEFLCQGLSPANISRILHIAPATTYKHIAHIYEKMRVSNRQELLVRLLK